MTDRPTHLMRDRAESFGAVAEQYDRWRPSYPAALIDDLVALGAHDVLDVGTGTGRAAALLAARGLSVTGLEIDPAMAAVARTHGLTVQVGAFETWDPAGRRFDLVTCAQAWHWIDPVAGLARAVGVLRPGGWLVPFWNYRDVDPQLRAAMNDVYARYAPALSIDGGKLGLRQSVLESWYTDPRLASVQPRRYTWQDSYPTADWLALLQTHSDHALLDPAVKAPLLDDLAAVIDAHGGQVVAGYTTYATFAQTADRPGAAGGTGAAS